MARLYKRPDWPRTGRRRRVNTGGFCSGPLGQHAGRPGVPGSRNPRRLLETPTTPHYSENPKETIRALESDADGQSGRLGQPRGLGAVVDSAVVLQSAKYDSGPCRGAPRCPGRGREENP